MNTLKVTIATPNGEVYSGDTIKIITMDTHSGSIGIMANHEAMVTTIKIGILKLVTEKDETIFFSVSEGFAECHGKEVTVMVQTAENAKNIDKHRAELAKKRAEERLANSENVDIRRAELALAKSLARLKAVELI